MVFSEDIGRVRLLKRLMLAPRRATLLETFRDKREPDFSRFG